MKPLFLDHPLRIIVVITLCYIALPVHLLAKETQWFNAQGKPIKVREIETFEDSSKHMKGGTSQISFSTFEINGIVKDVIVKTPNISEISGELLDMWNEVNTLVYLYGKGISPNLLAFERSRIGKGKRGKIVRYLLEEGGFTLTNIYDVLTPDEKKTLSIVEKTGLYRQREPLWNFTKGWSEVKFARDFMLPLLYLLMKFHHSTGMVHLDIKPENILVQGEVFFEGEKPYFQLIDFDFARKIGNTISWRRVLGTPLYIAPEMVQHEDEFVLTDKLDVFSLGLIFWEYKKGRQYIEGAYGGESQFRQYLAGIYWERIRSHVGNFVGGFYRGQRVSPENDLETFLEAVAGLRTVRFFDVLQRFSVLKESLEFIILEMLEGDHRSRISLDEAISDVEEFIKKNAE